MSLEFANQLLSSIMSYEDLDSTMISSQIAEDPATISHICFKNKNTEHANDNVLFRCIDNSPSYCLFSFSSSLDLNTLFKALAYPECDSISVNDRGVQVDIIWLQKLVHKLRTQGGEDLFNELLNSILVDLSVEFHGTDGLICFQFSKHSFYFKKNIHFILKFDMSFNFHSVTFNAYHYQDNYQQETLVKFKADNQLIAFHTLLVYYCHRDVHESFDEMINVFSDLNDDNLLVYNNLLGMIII